MRNLFSTTRRQAENLWQMFYAASGSALAVVVLVLGVVTSMLWKTGVFVAAVDALPPWLQLPVMMPLFGSMLSLYLLSGIAAISLVMSAAYDLMVRALDCMGVAVPGEGS
jgi:uncharacterized protein (DUF983 family)